MKTKTTVFLAFALLMMASVVAPVLADQKVYATRVIRDYSFMPGVPTPYGVFDIEQYVTMSITQWTTEDEGSRVLITNVVKVVFLQSGEVVGQGTTHSVVNQIVLEYPFTVVNQLGIKVTLRGSGQVANYHMTMVYVEGELVVFHEVGAS